MRGVATLSPKVKSQLGSLTTQVLDLSSRLGVDAVDAANAMYDAISAGVPPENIMTFLEVASKAAIGGMTDTETVINGLTNVMNAYGMSVDQAGRVSDVMFQAVNLGKLTMAELSGSIGQAAPMAAALGVSFEEVAAAATSITKQGVPASEAFTQINAAMVALQRTTPQMDTALKNLGFSSGQAMLQALGFQGTLEALAGEAEKLGIPLIDLTGRLEGTQAILELTGKNAQGARADLAAMGGAAGATDEAFKTMSEGMTQSWRVMTTTLSNELTKLGLLILPSLVPLVQGLTKRLPGAFAVAERAAKDAVEGISKTLKGIGAVLSDIAGDVKDGFDEAGVAGAIQGGFERSLEIAAAAIEPKAKGAGAAVMLALAGGLAAAPGVAQAARDAVQNLADDLKASAPVAEAAGVSLGAAIGAGINLGLGRVGGMVGLVGMIAAQIQEHLPEIEAAAKSLAAALSPALAPLEAFGRGIAESLAPAVQTLADQLPILAEALAPLGPPAQAVADAFAQIAGSFGGMSASAPEVSTGLGSVGETIAAMLPDWQVLAPLADQLGQSLLTLAQTALVQLPPLLTALGPLLTALGQTIQAVAPIISTVLTLAFAGALVSIDLFVRGITTGLPIAREILVSAINTMTTAVNAVKTVISGAVSLVQGLLSGNWTQAWEGAQQVATGAFQAIELVVNAIMPGMLQMISSTLATILDVWKVIFGFILLEVTHIFTSILDATGLRMTDINTAISTGMTTIQTTWETAWATVNTALGTAWETIQTTLGPHLTTLQSSLDTAMAQAQTAWETAWAKFGKPVETELDNVVTLIGNFVKSVYDAAYSVGTNAVQGLVDGINALIGAARAKVSELASLVSQVLSLGLGAHSPSTVTEAIGQDVINGLVLGLEETAPLLLVAVQTVAGQVGQLVQITAAQLGKPWLAAWQAAVKVVEDATTVIIARINATIRAALQLLQVLSRIPGANVSVPRINLPPSGAEMEAASAARGRLFGQQQGQQRAVTVNVYPQEATIDEQRLATILDRRLIMAGVA